jgi:UDP:flavonoid glycosyltransferase YjiC (YdhE family)
MLAKALILPNVRPVYEWIERNRRPETVVLGPAIAFGARIAREKLGVRLVTALLQPSLIRSRESIPGLPLIPTHPSLQFLARPMRSAVMWGVDAFLFDPALAKRTNAFRAELGLAPVRRLFHHWALSPDLCVGLFPDWYGQPQADWPPQVRCTGFPLYDESGQRPPEPRLERFLAAGEPPVTITPGTAMKHARRFFEVALEACGRIGRRALLLSHFPEQIPSPLPGFAAHFDYAPFSETLHGSAALVYHGGIGSAAQALRAGVPHLVCPFSYDQPDNAARLERLGVGKTVYPKLFRPGRVARKLDALLRSQEVAARCADYAQRIRSASPLEESCRLIENLSTAP